MEVRIDRVFFQLLCATAINLLGRKTKDGAIAVGAASVFHDNISNVKRHEEKKESEFLSDVDRLNEVCDSLTLHEKSLGTRSSIFRLQLEWFDEHVVELSCRIVV